MRNTIVTLTLLLVLAVSCSMASADIYREKKTIDAMCGTTTEELIVKFNQGVNEKVVAVGTDPNGFVYRMLIAPSGTWSFIVTHPKTGEGCFFFGGDVFEIYGEDGFENLGEPDIQPYPKEGAF